MDIPSITVAAAAVAASPMIWNIVARNEYRRHTMTKLVGDKYVACYLLAAWIFFSSLVRDYFFLAAVQANAALVVAPEALASGLWAGGTACIAVGLVLVVTSFWRLGITGTYLGDHYGIFMDARVTAFPFSVLENPMYVGAVLAFLGQALQYNSAVGVALAVWVHVVYEVATKVYENPFTAKIYAKLEQDKQKAKK
jgi:methylene-fatty-acyl-phospholipid synthase